MVARHRARHPGLWLPRRKPVGPVELDPNTPFAGLATVWWLDEQNPLIKRGGARGYNLAAVGSPALGISPQGPYRIMDGATAGYDAGETRSGDLTYLIVCMRSENTPLAGSSKVEEVLATRQSGGNGFEFNLGNGFGASGDMNKPRAATFGGGAALAARDGVIQSSVNPFDADLATGQWATFAVTYSGLSTGDNLQIGREPGAQFYLRGGIQLVVEWRGVALPAPLLAKLSADPYAIFRPVKRRTLYLVPSSSPGETGYSITGDVTATATPAATLDFTRHASLAGATTATATPAAAMDFTRNAKIAGSVTATATPEATLAYQRNASIAGEVTAATSVNADLVFTGHAAIAGAVTATATPAAALDFTRHAALAGSVAVAATPAASALAYQRNASIAGQITATVAVAADLAFTGHAAIEGAVTAVATPAATLDFTRHAAIAGSVSVTATVGAGLAFSSAGGIAGQVTATAVPAATFDFTRHAAIAGQVAVMVGVAAGMAASRSGAIDGAVTVHLAPAADMAYARHFAISGQTGVAIGVSAGMAVARAAAIDGQVQVAASVAAVLDIDRRFVLVGSVLVAGSAAAVFGFDRHAPGPFHKVRVARESRTIRLR